MNEEQARVILKLRQVDRKQRTAYWLAGKINMGVTKARSLLKILLSQGYVTDHISSNREIHYNPTNNGYREAMWCLFPGEMRSKAEEDKNENVQQV